ncbi:aminoglycoside phosphotransferase family protein [Microbacterium candidum]|uniref:Aminoglycoside phosphotransferase family protein n=1 Tax=Microbacterium candidum TaxID=3041922 RepID=A0ABT7MU39_9MICO|nr:aminoglycoside phosphotransferase family protein [Microbacterium sp. ASV49]MDL9977964.1 aminoglycoside phosphotransferase family protein [Microbacterium sp. ASV49]
MEITAALVSELVTAQFPEWAGLPVRPVPAQGWDNRTFRLGDDLSVRLPSGEAYVPGVAKEERVLRALAGRMPVAIPEQLASGAPGSGYPYPWSIRRWLPGETLTDARDVDRRALAADLGAALHTIRGLPTDAGPAAGAHSHFRGCHPSAYSDQVDIALERLGARVDATLCREIWLTATTSAWPSAPVWFHGDVASGNLLVEDRRLSAVIDFGTCGIGDPACDLVIAWTFFEGGERQEFRGAAGLDDATWQRARGWALWKALATMAGLSSPDPQRLHDRVLTEVLADPIV